MRVEECPETLVFKEQLRIGKEQYEAAIKADIEADPQVGKQLYEHLLKEAPLYEGFRRRLFGK